MTGSIEKRGKNSYRLIVSKGYDLDGKTVRHQKTIHCKNKSEAQIELAKFVAQIENGFIVEGSTPTFKEFVEIWKRDYSLKELAPSTYCRYKGMLETRIIPYFGHLKLNKIRPIDIIHFYNLLEEDTQLQRKKNNNGKKTRKPLSKKTILEHHRLIHAMLHKAVYWQMIVTNPAERVEPQKHLNHEDLVMMRRIVGDFWYESDRLFVQDDGKPIYPSTISKWFKKFIKQIYQL